MSASQRWLRLNGFGLLLVVVGLCGGLVSGIPGCGPTGPSGDNGGGGGGDGTVNVVPDDGPGSLVSHEGDTLRLAGGGETPQVSDVVVGTKDGGFLRRVESVTLEPDGSVTIVTSQAALTDVVEEGEFEFTDTAAKMGRRQKKIVSMRFSDDFSQQVIFEYQDLRVDIPSGEFGFDFDVELEIKIAKWKLKHFLFAVEGDFAAELDVRALSGGDVSFQGETQLIKVQKYFGGFIGIVPVVVEVTAVLVAGAEADASAAGEAATGFATDSYLRLGFSYDKGQWSQINENGFNFDSHLPTWTIEGQVEARGYLKPKIEVQLYSVVGPTIALEPYLGFTGDLGLRGSPSGAHPWYDWELSAGIRGVASIKADVLDKGVLEYSFELFDVSRILARDHDEWTVDADGDGVPDSSDGCPNDANKTTPGDCGCGTGDTDTDGDGTPDCDDPCPNDPTDNCGDQCPDDPDKTAPGTCGCGTPDTDSDGDGTPDCNDDCPNDPNKTAPGDCGCGEPETPGCGSNGGDTLTLDLGGGVTMVLVKIPAGTFMMGSPDGEGDSDEHPQHQVTISQPFYMGKYEVTQAQWQAVMGTTPWSGKSYVLEQSDCPATYVSWDDAQAFCQAVQAQTGYAVRLPSGAEWEYSSGPARIDRVVG